MPRDTPPPIPRPRPGRGANREPLGRDRGVGRGGDGEGEVEVEVDLSLPSKPVVGAAGGQSGGLGRGDGGGRKVYEAAPQIRDLRKEATARFVPSVVKRNIDASKGKRRLLEEEEVEGLERAGYAPGGAAAAAKGGQPGAAGERGRDGFMVDAAPDVGGDGDDRERERRRLAEEEERFAREMAMVDEEEDENDATALGDRGRQVQMEEVLDEEL